MGAYAAGAGYYNQQTAVARSINVDTAMRYNQYMYESNEEANRKHHAKLTGDKARTSRRTTRPRRGCVENPTQRDIYMGDALNALVDADRRSPGLFQNSPRREGEDRWRVDPEHSVPVRARARSPSASSGSPTGSRRRCS